MHLKLYMDTVEYLADKNLENAPVDLFLKIEESINEEKQTLVTKL